MVYSRQIRKEAETLHKRGLPYSQISAKLGIAKSTLSTWVGVSPRTPSDRKKQRAHLARIRPIAAETKRHQRLAWITEAQRKGREELQNLPLESMAFYKALLAMLYWAEGTKATRNGLNFVNTDPGLMSLYLTLLRKSYAIDERRIGARVHMHYYHKIREVRAFWSSTLGIPESQFGQIYVKKRSRKKRFRRNFMGICFVNYYDTKIREEILALGRGIEQALPKQCLLP